MCHVDCGEEIEVDEFKGGNGVRGGGGGTREGEAQESAGAERVLRGERSTSYRVRLHA